MAFGPLQTLASADGLLGTDHPQGKGLFSRCWNLLQAINAELMGAKSPLGLRAASMGRLHKHSRRLMSNPAVACAFTFAREESTRCGDSDFGNAVLTARKIVEQDQGTRFIQVEANGWDHHGDIYIDNGAKTFPDYPAVPATVRSRSGKGGVRTAT